MGRPAGPAGSAAGSPSAVAGQGLGRFLSKVDGIAQSYFTDIHGPQAAGVLAERRVTADVPDRLRFFSIYSDTSYAAGDHMESADRLPRASGSTTSRSASPSRTAATRR